MARRRVYKICSWKMTIDRQSLYNTLCQLNEYALSDLSTYNSKLLATFITKKSIS